MSKRGIGEEIVARKPIDGVAARVVSKGIHYEREFERPSTEQREPHPIDDMPYDGVPDLRGIRFGYFTVIGKAARAPKRYVVRCDCGMYALRTHRAVKNPGNTHDACAECRHVEYKRRMREPARAAARPGEA